MNVNPSVKFVNKIIGIIVINVSLFVPSIAIEKSYETVKVIVVTPLFIVRHYSPVISSYGGSNWDFSLFPYTLIPTIFILSSAVLGYFLYREDDFNFSFYNGIGILAVSLLHLGYFYGIMSVSQPRYSVTVISFPAIINIFLSLYYIYVLFSKTAKEEANTKAK